MSNRTKGALHEKKVADYLESQGYLTERGFKKVAWIAGRAMPIVKDLFGAFDIVAIKQPDEVRFIQVTAGGEVSHKIKVFTVWPKSEIWQHLRAGVYKIYRQNSSEVIDVKPKLAQP